jgi:hypothetical protein
LFLTAPFGIIVCVLAALRGAAMRLIGALLIASLILSFVGLMDALVCDWK